MTNDVSVDTSNGMGNGQYSQNEPISAENIKLGIAIALAGLIIGGVSLYLLFNRGEPKHAGTAKHSAPQAMQAAPIAAPPMPAHTALPGLLPNADPAAVALVLQVQQQQHAAAQSQLMTQPGLAQPGLAQQSVDGTFGVQTQPVGMEMQTGPVQIDHQGQVLTETVSGYPIYNSGAPKAVDAGGDNPNWNVTRSGLVGNPCVDPPSSRGRAYNASNAY